MSQLLKNNVSGVVSTPLSTGATTLTLSNASDFPAPTSGQFYLVTLIGLNANAQEAVWEIVKVTAKASNTLTIQRAQEGTLARAWPSGTTAQMRLTASSVVTPTLLASLESTIQSSLGTKAPLNSPSFTGTVSGVSKAMVGLGNVDNTSDASKPVSTATQAALATKEPVIAPGTSAQYYRGDKTMQPLNKAAVGLGSVDNVSATSLRDRTTHTGSQAISTITNLQSSLDSKVSKVVGKDLSTNDFTNAEKIKLDGVEAGAQVNLVPVNNVISTSTTLPLSANQGRVLKSYIDAINSVLQSDDTSLDQLQEIVSFIKLNRTTLDTLGIANIAGLTAALAGKVDSTDSRLTNAREWTASTVSQAEAEAGTSTTIRKWSAQRIRQAILGWWSSSTDKTKLDGISTQATKNASDAQLRDRATHTGTQPVSTITGLQGALDSKITNGGNVTFGNPNTFRWVSSEGKNYFQSGDGSGSAGWNNLVFSPYSSSSVYGEITPNGFVGKGSGLTHLQLQNIVGIGTAASHDVTTNNYDFTAGRLLKVGDFGIGANALTQDPDANTKAGVYSIGQYSKTVPGGTIPGWATYVNLMRSAHGEQLFVRTGTLQFRSKSSGGVGDPWGDLYTVWHNGNFDPATKVDLTALGTAASANLTVGYQDATVGRVLKVGDYGLGLNLDDYTFGAGSLDNLTGSGLHSVAGAAVTGKPPGATNTLAGSCLVIRTGTGGRVWQQYIETGGSGPNRVWTRTRIDNTNWSPWQEFFHTGNFDPASKLDASTNRFVASNGFASGKFEMVFNTVTDSLEFNFTG